ncbi:MAG TPA: hypothetical protein VM123_04220 [archaeon]|nr:hypothetical protein [archaeon]
MNWRRKLVISVILGVLLLIVYDIFIFSFNPEGPGNAIEIQFGKLAGKFFVLFLFGTVIFFGTVCFERRWTTNNSAYLALAVWAALILLRLNKIGGLGWSLGFCAVGIFTIPLIPFVAGAFFGHYLAENYLPPACKEPEESSKGT